MSEFRKIGVIGAMDSEVEYLVSQLEDSAVTEALGLSFYSGTLRGKYVTVVRCGVGKVNAARTAQLLIDRFAPDAVINSGIAGGIDPELSVGDAVVAAGLVQHDFDLSAIGAVRGAMAGSDMDKPTVFKADERLAEALFTAASRVFGRAEEGKCDASVARGIIATGDIFVADPSLRKSLRESFDAAAAEMEGGAIAQVCTLCGVPFAVLRVLSDTADGNAPESFETFEKKTADLSAAIVEEFIELL